MVGQTEPQNDGRLIQGTLELFPMARHCKDKGAQGGWVQTRFCSQATPVEEETNPQRRSEQ
jgi:hypothetical protein